MTVLRTSRDGCWELRSNSWGQYLAPTVDPDADTVITQEQLKGFELNSDIHKIPTELWNRWVKLCIEMCKRGTGDLEVSCRLLRNISDPSTYRICIPKQKVTGASVRVETFDKAVDIETGEVIEQWPPEGWVPCGSSHSHNTMNAFFSGTDDKYELGDPGLHIVVGKIDVDTGAYELCASITANMRRFDIEPKDVVVYQYESEPSYAPNCLDVISINSLNPIKPYSSSFSSLSYSTPLTFATPPSSDVPSCLSPEVDAVRNAYEKLIAEGTRQGIDTRKILENLAGELDDLAYFTEAPSTDPFYWNDDSIL